LGVRRLGNRPAPDRWGNEIARTASKQPGDFSGFIIAATNLVVTNATVKATAPSVTPNH